MINKKKSAGLAGYIRNGSMTEKGIDVICETLNEFKHVLSSIELEDVFVFATAPLRNINNTEMVLNAVRLRCNMEIQVLSGSQEAEYDYYGAFSNIRAEDGLVVDIGGGSTELVYFSGGVMQTAISIDIGSLNMYSRFVKRIIPTDEEIAKIKSETEKRLDEADLDEFSCRSIYAVGGTARAAIKMYNEIYEMPKENSAFRCKELKKMQKCFSGDEQGIISILLLIAPERIHTFIPGITILRTVAKYFNCDEINVCSYGVRDGYILKMLEKRGELNEG
jgi:exopolyphosphatase/guanosine-5'-triphosphate,3'-diphosphate pyrophosphatase